VRILFINSIQVYGGGEVWMVTAAGELQRRGHQVTIVCRPGSPLQHHAERAGLPVVPLEIHGDLDPRTIWSMIRLIGRLRVDVILTNTDKELRFAGAASLLRGGPPVICRKGIDHPLKDTLGYRLTYNRLAAAVVANSQATRQTLLGSAPWLDPDRVHVIHNGIDPAGYQPEQTRDLYDDLGLPATASVVGFVGRLSPQKGLEFLLPAFATVAARLPDAHLLLVGEGELDGMIRDFAAEHRLADRICLAGFRDDIPDVMRTLDVCVLPSLWEGFGIVLIEAMAAGKPCVTTRISSMPEIVRDPQTGRIVPPRDPQALADALLAILEDPDAARQMGEAGRAIMHRHFTLSAMVERYEDVFRRHIGRGRRESAGVTG